MRGVRKVHHRDASLVPGLYFNIATRNWNERTVVGHAVLSIALCRWHLVIAGEFQLIVFQVKNRVGTPLIWIGRAASCSEAATPFIREHDFLSIVRKRGRVPICVVLVIDCIDSFWLGRILYIEQYSIS